MVKVNALNNVSFELDDGEFAVVLGSFGAGKTTLLNLLVFSTMGLGTLGGITWFWWLVTPLIVLLFTGPVALVLRRKIVKVNINININESLKAFSF